MGHILVWEGSRYKPHAFVLVSLCFPEVQVVSPHPAINFKEQFWMC